MMTLLVLYHDLYNLGHQRVLKEVDTESKYTDWSLRHNAHLIRGTLAEWRITKMPIGKLEQCKATNSNSRLSKELKEVCLWIDSTDVPLQKYKGWSKKSDDFSFKVNGSARQFLVLTDGKNVVRKVGEGSLRSGTMAIPLISSRTGMKKDSRVQRWWLINTLLELARGR